MSVLIQKIDGLIQKTYFCHSSVINMETRHRILLVEDEMGVADFIFKGLTEGNYEVSVALNGKSGLEMILSSTFDLIILDIMLPDISGLDICSEIRAKDIKTPVLFLTALGTADNIALGLNTGADDYIVKPFKFIELNARINALIRRSHQMDDNDSRAHRKLINVADMSIDDDAKMVTRNGKEIVLTATEYRLLIALARNKNKVLSRMDLLESAWDIDFNVGTNVVDVYINYLRKKIDSEHELKLIQTVIGMGYVLKDK